MSAHICDSDWPYMSWILIAPNGYTDQGFLICEMLNETVVAVLLEDASPSVTLIVCVVRGVWALQLKLDESVP